MYAMLINCAVQFCVKFHVSSSTNYYFNFVQVERLINIYLKRLWVILILLQRVL